MPEHLYTLLGKLAPERSRARRAGARCARVRIRTFHFSVYKCLEKNSHRFYLDKWRSTPVHTGVRGVFRCVLTSRPLYTLPNTDRTSQSPVLALNQPRTVSTSDLSVQSIQRVPVARTLR